MHTIVFDVTKGSKGVFAMQLDSKMSEREKFPFNQSRVHDLVTLAATLTKNASSKIMHVNISLQVSGCLTRGRMQAGLV